MLKSLLLFSCFALSGCTAVLVGGAGAGGYTVGKDERSIGQITEDASITTSINTTFVRDDIVEVMDIDVDTANNVVTLHGAVASHKVIKRAVKLARTTKGVRKVVSKLEVVSN